LTSERRNIQTVFLFEQQQIETNRKKIGERKEKQNINRGGQEDISSATGRWSEKQNKNTTREVRPCSTTTTTNQTVSKKKERKNKTPTSKRKPFAFCQATPSQSFFSNSF